jgi:hypothetical protein
LHFISNIYEIITSPPLSFSILVPTLLSVPPSKKNGADTNREGRQVMKRTKMILLQLLITGSIIAMYALPVLARGGGGP